METHTLIQILMKFLQHDDPEVRIPQHISRIVFYTSPLFLLSSYSVYIRLGHSFLSFLLFSLFFTTLCHWNKVCYQSWIKMLDIFFASGVLSVTTFYSIYYLDIYYHRLWNISVFTSLCAFFINEYVFYYRVYPKQSLPWAVRVLDITYTPPNTMEREHAYYLSTYIHMFFLHILPNITCIYCVNSCMDSQDCSYMRQY